MKNLMKIRAICIAATLLLTTCGTIHAATTIDFDAVAYRPGDDGSYGTAQEYADGTGMSASTPVGGQKILYGTEYFNGWALSDIASIQFTYEAKDGIGRPYSNLVITDGLGSYGVISSRNRVSSRTTYEDNGEKYFVEQCQYNFSVNNSYGFSFYEPYGASAWSHGDILDWDDISSWYILGAGESRPLSSGEVTAGYARGPIEHGLNLIWGDSKSNYLGDIEIYDVSVITTSGDEYVAGTSTVPAPGAILLAGLGTACVGRIRRKI